MRLLDKHFLRAQVAELVDALASGASARMGVEVRVFSWAPFSNFQHPVCFVGQAIALQAYLFEAQKSWPS